MRLDKGLEKTYDSDMVRELVKEFGYIAHVHSCGERIQAFQYEAGFKSAVGLSSGHIT